MASKLVEANSSQNSSNLENASTSTTQTSEQSIKLPMTCSLCQAPWYDHRVTQGCPVCGGYPLSRPCPICNGTCGKIWHRDLRMSHQMKMAHWNGDCGQPEEVQMAFFLQNAEMTDEDVFESFGDLSSK